MILEFIVHRIIKEKNMRIVLEINVVRERYT